MHSRLNGLAWIFFGMLLVLISAAGGLGWIPVIGYISGDLWCLAALACGVWGLVLVQRSDP